MLSPIASASPLAALSDDDVVHSVGNAQYLLDVLGFKVPRALCGVLLTADPDRADPAHRGMPSCPMCVEIGGAPGASVPAHALRSPMQRLRDLFA